MQLIHSIITTLNNICQTNSLRRRCLDEVLNRFNNKINNKLRSLFIVYIMKSKINCQIVKLIVKARDQLYLYQDMFLIKKEIQQCFVVWIKNLETPEWTVPVWVKLIQLLRTVLLGFQNKNNIDLIFKDISLWVKNLIY